MSGPQPSTSPIARPTLPAGDGPTTAVVDRIVRTSSATVDAALQAGVATGGGPAGATAIIRVLGSALQRDAQGRTQFDITEQALVDERSRIERELRRRGAAPDLVQRLLSNLISLGKVQRERERVEGLLSLMVSITFGSIPKGTVNRLVELGFGDDVQRALREAIGNGRHLSRGAIRDLMALATSGLGTGGTAMPDVGAAPEHQTEAYYRDEDERLARNASATGGARLVDAQGRTLPDAPGSRPQGADLSSALRARAAATLSW